MVDENCEVKEGQNEDQIFKAEVGGGMSWANTLNKILKCNSREKRGGIILSKRKIKECTQQLNSNNKNLCPSSQVAYWTTKGKLKPNVLDKEKEKALQKIAVRGVVHLFNAVQAHQKSINQKLKECEKSEIKTETLLKKVDRKSFFDVFLGEKTKEENEETEIKVEGDNETSVWEPLQDHFMISSKMKNWDMEET